VTLLKARADADRRADLIVDLRQLARFLANPMTEVGVVANTDE
jgi:hypothetical protein